MNIITYVAGHAVERPAHRRNKSGLQISYRWVRGYHRLIGSKITYPAMTRRECLEDAKREGAKAKFVEETI